MKSPPDSSNNRRQPLLPPTTSPLRAKKPNVGECAGSTAAECAAVCCCCPFVLVEFLVLAVYRIPTGICRRIWRNRRLKNKLKKRRLMNQKSLADSARRTAIHYLDTDLSKVGPKIDIDGSPEIVDLEEEMWERFRNSGFGRSLSQRHG